MDVAASGIKFEVDKDNSKVTLRLEPPSEGNPYNVDDIVAVLRNAGVVSGINYTEIENMVRMGYYYKEVVVARSKEPINGKDAYYDFFFDLGNVKHPTIRSDGSVDYQSMNIIHSVNTGDVLAVYHGAVPGQHGYDVKGREMRCRPGKELPPLKGNGFTVDADGVTYRASTEGRVEYDNYKLFIRDVYEVKGDLDLLTGRVDFRGDVIVHGSVRAGTFIRASKSITVEGNVESAVLIAEGDIVLKKGMQGGSKAKIVCGGDLYAYFLEFAEISVKGNVEANIILNCKVNAGKSINVKGKKGLVVGGSYQASGAVNSTNIGNPANVRTICNTGISNDITVRNHLLMTKLEAAKRGIKNSRKAIEEASDIRISKDPKEVREARINQLRRHIKRDERMIEHLEKEIEEIRVTMECSKNATISAQGHVYPGVVVRIDNKEMVIEKDYNAVRFFKNKNNDAIEVSSI